MANLLATYGIARESRIALLLLDTVGFPGRLLGRHQGRRRAGVPQHAADDRAVRLHPRRQPRQGARSCRRRCCPWCSRSSASCRSSSTSSWRAARRRRSRSPCAASCSSSRAEFAGRRHLLRRDRVLALLVGLHRHAQGRAPRALEPDGDGAPHRPGLPRRARGRPRLLRRQAVLRLRPRQRHVVSRCRSAPPPCCCPSGRRRRWCSARSSSTSRPCSSACRRSTRRCWPIRRARPRTARSACACASRPARRCRPRSARPSSAKFGVDVLDGVGSTEMLHQYVCNSPGDVKYGTSGKPIPGYEIRLVDEQGKDVPDGEVGEMLVRGPERRRRLLEPAREEPRHLRGRLDALGRQVHARRRGLLHLPGPHRRHVQGVGHLGVAVRGGERADRPRRRAGGGRGAQGGRRRPAEAQGLHRAEARQDRGQRPARTSCKEHVKAKAGVWKYPRWIEFVDGLPKTATGKIQRFKLREG